jgi:hypothetical protein
MNSSPDSIQKCDEYFNYLKYKLDLDDNDISIAFEKYNSLIDCNNDRFVILIHLIMLQNGFMYTSSDCATSIFLTKHKYFSQLNYNFYKFNKIEIKFETNIKIIINFMSNINRLTIQAFFKNYSTLNIFYVNKKQIDSCLASTESENKCNEELRSLIIEFKNLILNPLKLYFYETYNRGLLIGKSIIYLPNEILLKIVKYLDIKSIVNLSRMCKLFRSLTFEKNLIKSDRRILAKSVSLIPDTIQSCNLLWKHFLKRDFKKDFDKTMETNNDSCNFLLVYKECFERVRKRRYRSFCNPYGEFNYYYND